MDTDEEVDRSKCYHCRQEVNWDHTLGCYPLVAEVGTFCDIQCVDLYENKDLDKVKKK